MTKKEAKKNRRRKKIFLAIIMILFTGVLLTTSTYAWFTANRTVTVEQFDVNVSASNGLQISVDGITWKPNITKADILSASNTYNDAKNQVPEEDSKPVSTTKTIDANTGFMNMYAGTIETADGQFILTSEKSTETNGTTGDFIAFDLFFRTTEATQLYLTSASNVKHSDGNAGLENAARVAFVQQGNTTAGAAISEIQGLKASASSEVKLWEPNSDVHTAAAVNNANNPYGLTTTVGPNAAPLEYYGVNAVIGADAKVPLNSKLATYFAKVTPDIVTKAAGIGDTYEQAFMIQAGITKVRIYMWVEGQDVDCEDNASGGSVGYNLQFSMNANSGVTE